MSFESDLVKEEMRKHPHSKSPLIRNIKKILKKKGWKFDSNEHSMAAKGIKTKMKNNPAIEFEKMLAR
jgi:NADH:ubiquinone oxidoreductase subunit E